MRFGPRQTYRIVRLPVIAAGLALAVTGAACGGDDESLSADEAASTTAPPAERSTTGERAGNGGSADAPELLGNVEQARAGATAVDEVYESFGAAVEAGVAAADVDVHEGIAAAGRDASLARVCDLMSEQAKRQTITYADRSAGLAGINWTCESATGLLLRRASRSGGLDRSLRAEIVGVNVDGDRATASVRFGGKSEVSAIPLVKEGGEWKLGASPSGGAGL